MFSKTPLKIPQQIAQLQKRGLANYVIIIEE